MKLRPTPSCCKLFVTAHSPAYDLGGSLPLSEAEESVGACGGQWVGLFVGQGVEEQREDVGWHLTRYRAEE